MKKKLFNSVNEMVFKTCSKTFAAYWKELRRHEQALQKIYGNDRNHEHVPEDVGTVQEAEGRQRVIVTFRRCALCLKDLPPRHPTQRKHK